MRWFVTGSEGQLGTCLRQQLAERGEPHWGRDLDLDVADGDAVEAALRALPGGPPDLLVNAAAFTHVDRCEREPELALRVNAEAPAELARRCATLGVKLVHVSTDYVFDGTGDRPYREDDPPAPSSVYGRTKLAGEEAVRSVDDDFLVVRTSWVFGPGRNFIVAILAQAEGADPADPPALRVVSDQHGRPTYADDLAAGILGLVEAGSGGLYHLAGAGEATWWELARAALDARGFGDRVVDEIATHELSLDAPRPAYSVLDTTKAEGRGVVLRPWRDALRAYLDSDHAPAPGASR